MAVPSKPTAKLSVDGVFGAKTRDAAAWVFKIDPFAYDSSQTILRKAYKSTTTAGKKVTLGLQKYLNQKDYWEHIALWDVSNTWSEDLDTDGVWGSQTEMKYGASIAYLSNGTSQGCKHDESVLSQCANSIKCFQALLNGIIFREKPKGPSIVLVNTTPTFKQGPYTWEYVPTTRV